MNWQGMLPGLLQSNQRAELFAVLVACMRDPRPLEIRSDSRYVCDAFARLQTWTQHGWCGEHADLWNLLAAEVNTRMHAVSLSWVLGHAKRIDVLRGRTTWEDKLGNDGADVLAVAGAATHAIPPEIIQKANDRRCVAIRVHTMMLDITRARQSANLVECEGDADRGSDLGDDFDSDCCDSANEDTCTDSDNEHTSACIDNLDDELTRDDPL